MFPIPFAIPKLAPFMWKTMGVVLLIISSVLFYNHWRSSLIEEGRRLGKAEVQKLWDNDKAEQRKVVEQQLKKRLEDNAREKERQDLANVENERKHHAELDRVRRALATERLRRGKSLCTSGTAAGAAQTAGTGFRDDPDSPGELFPEQVEADIKQLIYETEVVAAAARSCQQFVRDNGLYKDPPRTETVEPKDPNPGAEGEDHGIRTEPHETGTQAR